MALPVDIIVPVYRGERETRACLESVLGAPAGVECEVIVVDDASPEAAIRAWLAELAKARRIRLVSHERNRGFVASVNEAMALHPDRDVVLLNSDTEVAEGWLARLAHHARLADAGTVTPFSNNATICSYPRALEPNAIPEGETTATLDRAFAAANAARSVQIPTAVGFCMYVTRRCLQAVGAFDEATYGSGYGEEVDFCMRAARAGFRHLLAGDVFVHHVGEVSFGSAGAERREKAQATVDRLYPEFQPRLAEHLARDPARGLRRRADLERLRRASRPRVLFVSHRHGGGIKRHVDELAAALAPHAEVLLLQPNAHSYLTLRWLRRGEELQLWMLKQSHWPWLLALLRAVGIARVHLHHVEGLPPAVLDLPRELGCPHDVTLHDYFAVCPQYHLVDGSGRYCGEPGGTACLKCGELAPIPWPVSIAEWRDRFRRFLESAARVLAPSHDCAQRIARYFPQVRAEVRPHPQEASHAAPAVRVLVPGALSPAKGVDLLEACAREARTRGLPLHFHVLGYVARPLPTWPELPLTLSGEYPEGTLAALIAAEHGDAIFFPAQCPETYSYTLTEAVASGLPIVATDLGALPERLAGHTSARLLPWNATATAFNDALLAVAPPLPPPARRVETVSMADYVRSYLEPIPRTAGTPAGQVPEIEAGMLADPREPGAVPTLAQLFDDGVVCGVAGSLAQLRERAAAAADEAARERALRLHAEAHARLEAARREADELQVALRQAQARAAELQASTSWRLTAPLRALVRLLRGR